LEVVDTQLNQRAKPFINPLCVALDVDTTDKAQELSESLADIVGGFKIGPRLIHRYGPEILKKISSATVFVDCKFFDIPSTMEAAVSSCFEMGARVVTVHALAGATALETMAKIEAKFSTAERPCRVLPVTVLTSWDQQSLPSNFLPVSISEHVQKLAQLVQESGLKGLVCSGEELQFLKPKLAEDFFYLVPGIRFKSDEVGDQKRVMDPPTAMRAGASALVVGRPILNAKSPREAAMDFIAAIYEKKST
jgi:orotidine-5'-phosphate decarboxylase